MLQDAGEEMNSEGGGGEGTGERSGVRATRLISLILKISSETGKNI